MPNISITFTDVSASEAQRLLDAAAGITMQSETAAPAKRGPGRPAKMGDATLATITAVPQTAAAPAAAPTAAPAVTKEAVGAAFLGLIQANKRDAVVAILSKYGAKAVSNLKPESYAAAIADAEAAALT